MPFIGLDCAIQTGPTTAAFDRVSGGEIGFDQSIEHLTGVAGADGVVYSMIEPKGSVDTFLQSTSLLTHVTRAAVNGLPTVITTIDGGVLGENMIQHGSGYINSCKLSCEVGGVVKASYEWVALDYTASAVTTAAAQLANNLLLAWHGASVLLDGATYSCQSWESTIENGLKLHTSLDAKTVSDTQRLPESVTPGNQKVSLTAEFKAAPSIDFTADNPVSVTFAFTAVNTESSAKTFAHTVGALHPVSMPQKIAAGEDEVTWSIELEADYNDLTAWTYTLS
jgi:hypothetical protein